MTLDNLSDAVGLAASSDTLTAYDDDTAAILHQLLSSRAAPTKGVVDMPALTLSANDITSAIKSFLAGSARDSMVSDLSISGT